MSAIPTSCVTDATLPWEDAAAQLGRSPNPCDQRKARDLRAVLEAGRGLWAGRVQPAGAGPGPGHGLALVARLRTPGLVWDDRAVPHDDWLLCCLLPPRYPLAHAVMRFLGRVPYNPHVTHRQFLPDERQVPPDLRHLVTALTQGLDGLCCFTRTADWSSAVTHDLALAIRQVSRVLAGHIFGEAAALNHHARDGYLRLIQAGRMPLGPALPRLPTQAVFERPLDPAGADDPDVQWM